MHVGPLRVDNEKMSKSLGNFFTIREVLAKYRPEVLRFLLLSSHYRSPINYSEDSLQQAQAGLERFYAALRDFGDVAPLPAAELAQTAYAARFREAMDEDFNTPGALAVMHEIARELNTAAREGDAARARGLAAELRGFGAILGLLGDDPLAFRRGGTQGADDAEIDALVAERVAAKKAKDFARADAIREQLRARGIVIEDTRDGSVWRRDSA